MATEDGGSKALLSSIPEESGEITLALILNYIWVIGCSVAEHHRLSKS